MWILLWIAFGALAGWIASMITGKNSQMGALGNIITGLVGSLIGSWIASMFGIGSYTQFSIGSLIISIIGAVVLLWIVGMFSGRKK